MNRRQERLSTALRGAIQSVIDRGFQDPRIRGMITITEVEVSEDRRQATVRVSVMPEEHQELTVHGLMDAARYIRREAAEKIRVHQMPRLSIKLDTSLKKQAGVLDALSRARSEFKDEPFDAIEEDASDSTANDADQPVRSPTPATDPREEAS